MTTELVIGARYRDRLGREWVVQKFLYHTGAYFVVADPGNYVELRAEGVRRSRIVKCKSLQRSEALRPIE